MPEIAKVAGIGKAYLSLAAPQSDIFEKINYLLLRPSVKGSVVGDFFGYLDYFFSRVSAYFCHHIPLHFAFWQCSGV